MTLPTVSAALAAERARDLQEAAARHRLAALARCCRPAGWRRVGRGVGRGVRTAGAGVAAWFRRDEPAPHRICCPSR